MSRLPLVAALFAILSVPALAQTTPPSTRIYGTIESFDGHLLRVKADDGRSVVVSIADDQKISALAERKLSDIVAGDYVGSAAVKGADGKLHALEVHIFPEALRGAGEGFKPMDNPEQSMTNATVAEVKSPAEGTTLRLSYKGGEQSIEVGKDARIVGLIAGDRTLLKPGATVRVSGAPAADGTVTARFVQAEKDGVPPFNF